LEAKRKDVKKIVMQIKDNRRGQRLKISSPSPQETRLERIERLLGGSPKPTAVA